MDKSMLAAENSLRQTILDWLITPPPSVTGTVERRNAQITAALIFILSFFQIIGFFITLNVTEDSNFQLVFGGMVAATILAYMLSRTKFYIAGGFTATGALAIANFLFILARPYLDATSVLNTLNTIAPLTLIIASAILPQYGLVIIVSLNSIGTLLLPFFTPIYEWDFAVQNSLIFFIFGLLLFSVNLYRELTEKQRLADVEKANQNLSDIRANLEERVGDRTRELNRRSNEWEAAAFVSRSAAEVRNVSEIFDNVVTQITNRFGFYHAAIFTPDVSGRFAVLRAVSSPGGKKMLERGYRLEVGRQGSVGYAAYQKRPRIAVDTDPNFLNNPDLPTTRAEAALPLLVQDRLIGILDIQSEEHSAFTSENIATLQTMADQIALAIENARLLNESQLTLDQLQRLNQTNAGAAWNLKLKEERKGYLYTPLGVSALTENLQNENNTGEKTIRIPVNLRGKTIGMVALKRKTNESDWIEAEREMLERIALQIGLAVENARLLEESQHRASREQLVNEFSNRFNQSLDVDTLLQNAAKELYRLPQVTDVSVYITPQKESEPKI